LANFLPIVAIINVGDGREIIFLIVVKLLVDSWPDYLFVVASSTLIAAYGGLPACYT
jgi:hypothetical protein